MNWDKSDTEEVVKGVLIGALISLTVSAVGWVVDKYILTEEKDKEKE